MEAVAPGLPARGPHQAVRGKRNFGVAEVDEPVGHLHTHRQRAHHRKSGSVFSYDLFSQVHQTPALRVNWYALLGSSFYRGQHPTIFGQLVCKKLRITSAEIERIESSGQR